MHDLEAHSDAYVASLVSFATLGVVRLLLVDASVVVYLATTRNALERVGSGPAPE